MHVALMVSGVLIKYFKGIALKKYIIEHNMC